MWQAELHADALPGGHAHERGVEGEPGGKLVSRGPVVHGAGLLGRKLEAGGGELYVDGRREGQEGRFARGVDGEALRLNGDEDGHGQVIGDLEAAAGFSRVLLNNGQDALRRSNAQAGE